MRRAGTFVALPGDPGRGLRKGGAHGKGHRVVVTFIQWSMRDAAKRLQREDLR